MLFTMIVGGVLAAGAVICGIVATVNLGGAKKTLVGALYFVTMTLLVCAGLSMYLVTHAPVKHVTKEKEVQKKVYVLAPDGKTTGDVKTAPDGKIPSTGFTMISDWSNPETDKNWGDGFAIIDVDGQRCIVWIRNTSSDWNGSQTGSGMSCRPMTTEAKDASAR